MPITTGFAAVRSRFADDARELALQTPRATVPPRERADAEPTLPHCLPPPPWSDQTIRQSVNGYHFATTDKSTTGPCSERTVRSRRRLARPPWRWASPGSAWALVTTSLHTHRVVKSPRFAGAFTKRRGPRHHQAITGQARISKPHARAPEPLEEGRRAIRCRCLLILHPIAWWKCQPCRYLCANRVPCHHPVLSSTGLHSRFPAQG